MKTLFVAFLMNMITFMMSMYCMISLSFFGGNGSEGSMLFGFFCMFLGPVLFAISMVQTVKQYELIKKDHQNK